MYSSLFDPRREGPKHPEHNSCHCSTNNLEICPPVLLTEIDMEGTIGSDQSTKAFGKRPASATKGEWTRMLLLHKKSFLGIGLAALVVVGMIVGIGASRFHRSRSNGHAAAAQDSSPEEEPQDDDTVAVLSERR